MRSFLAGQAVTLDVLFEQGVDTVIPDVASVTYTLYDNNGAQVSGAVDVAVTTDGTSTSVPITIASGKNGKTGLFEHRTLVVKYKLNGGDRQQQLQYRLTDFVPMTATADGARSLIGAARNELPDQDLDFYQAYIEVCAEISSASVNAALISAGQANFSANRAIVCRALLDLLPSLQFRLVQSSKSNTAQISRFTKVDFVALTDFLTTLYNDALEIIDPSEPTSDVFGAGVLIGVTSPDVDPITGS